MTVGLMFKSLLIWHRGPKSLTLGRMVPKRGCHTDVAEKYLCDICMNQRSARTPLEGDALLAGTSSAARADRICIWTDTPQSRQDLYSGWWLVADGCRYDFLVGHAM